MRDKIAYVREWWEEASAAKKIALAVFVNGGIILTAAVLAISAVAISHLVALWNLVIG